MMRTHDGHPEPLGLTLADDGANVAVYSAHAERIELCLFDDADHETRIALPARTGDVFHGFIEGVTTGTRYGLRAHGPYAPTDGHRFNPHKLLVDPHARALDRAFAFHPSMRGENADGSRNDDESAPYVPKAIAIPAPTPARSARPQVPCGETVLYELHVRGFTKLHPGVPAPLRGTCAALAQPPVIEHLRRIGVTSVELMPVAAAIDEPHLSRLGRTNYWGYNTVGWFVPDPRLAPGGIGEVRDAVAALHEAGIEVILDVVFNHSGEGDAHGPTLSLRGLDNATYYRLPPDARHRYADDSGCGNTLALDRAPVVALVLDALRYWAQATGADGFRFDLATALGRRDAGFAASAPLLTAISSDPLLRTLKLIAEPWDVGRGGYQAGAFPAEWSEWNDKYRDTVRRWWRGDPAVTGDLATRLAGSADVFRGRQRRPSRSINYVTSHDGFTLADLVSYAQKHNDANGEGNRDGTELNYSWNHGVEGASRDSRVHAARRHDVRALLATLLCSRGTPMLSMGDEFGRTQRGNNNAYAQDNELTWLDWEHADQSLADFVATFTALRRAHPALRADRWLSGVTDAATSLADVQWLRADGAPMTPSDWDAPNLRTLVAVFADGSSFTTADRVAIVLNAAVRDTPVLLPGVRRGFAWHHVLDSAAEPALLDRNPLLEPAALAVRARSVAIVVERPVMVSAPRPVFDAGHSASANTIERTPAHAASRQSPPASKPAVFPRSAGILLHPTSLPGPHGIGDLGPDAHRFVDVLADAGMGIWQMLPLGPTGYGDSPYQCFSAFAGNPLLIHLPADGCSRPTDSVDYGAVITHKQALLRRATDAMAPPAAYQTFLTEHASWLEDFALFMALKHAHGGAAWTSWEPAAARRDPAALKKWRSQLAADIEHVRREQYMFFMQFRALRAACHAKKIRVMGDLPMYVAEDSADVWANPHLFQLAPDGRPTAQAGVPPDYFSATGQLWGNPIYNWEALRATRYDWWVRRMRGALEMFDMLRIDHFRGFEAYWEVPGNATTAVNGTWVPGPGAALFEAMTAALGPLPIVAENLGVITPTVEALRAQFGYPGMSVLQFAFGSDSTANHFLPHMHTRDCVVYTGTHDNDTAVGWWQSKAGSGSTRSASDLEQERAFARKYLGTDGHDIQWTLIRAALASVADTALIPLQDVLGLGSDARMNRPGKPDGNWRFRFAWDQLTPDLIGRLRALVALYNRQRGVDA